MRGQTVAEFVFVSGAVIMIVAVVAVAGFREAELTVGLASARLAASNFSVQNPAFNLAYMNYSVNESSRRVILRPKFYNFSSGGISPGSANDSVVSGAVWALQHAFHPASAGAFTVGSCVRASYYEYCVSPCFGAEASACEA